MKTKTRPIIVNGVQYRWLISTDGYFIAFLDGVKKYMAKTQDIDWTGFSKETSEWYGKEHGNGAYGHFGPAEARHAILQLSTTRAT